MALILPWAKQEHAEKYAQTLAVARRGDVFDRYLLRLVELRCAEDRAFLRTVPLWVLDNTAVTCRMRGAGRGEFVVGGKRTEPVPQVRWWQLSLSRADFDSLMAWVDLFDLQTVDAHA